MYIILKTSLFQTDAYLMDDQGLIPPPLDYPPPNYAVYEGDHARTLPHPHRNKDMSGHSTLGRSAGTYKGRIFFWFNLLELVSFFYTLDGDKK